MTWEKVARDLGDVCIGGCRSGAGGRTECLNRNIARYSHEVNVNVFSKSPYLHSSPKITLNLQSKPPFTSPQRNSLQSPLGKSK